MESWKDPLTPFVWLSLGVLLISVLLAAIALIVRGYVRRIRADLTEKNRMEILYQQELIRASIEVQERERERMSSSLHDGLITQLRRLLMMAPEGAIADTLHELIHAARNISHELMPPLLNVLSFEELIKDFIYPLLSEYEISFYHSCDSAAPIGKETLLHLYRIFQELMSNIFAHARARSIQINLRMSSRLIYLSVRDDGVGGDFENAKGLGLRNIELRANLINAHYKIEHQGNRGTCFSMVLNQGI